MLTPANYAARYLPLQVSNGQDSIPIRIDRYHLGAPTADQQQLWTALGDHFIRQKRKDRNYRLTLTVNGAPVPVGDREEIRMPCVRPFYGKGSPEDCQIVLQLALILNLSSADRLQAWANDNLGLDCNGYVGNYLFREWLGRPWNILPGDDDPGPSQTIDKLFTWVAGDKEEEAVTDVDQLDPSKPYMVVRTDQNGRVIPGGKVVGHVALTEPNYYLESFDGSDLHPPSNGMNGKPALKSVESAGQATLANGVGQNWLVFVGQLRPKGVFQVNRDNIRLLDTVKLAPLPDFEF